MTLLFGKKEPTEEDLAEGWEADTRRGQVGAPCLTYRWIGQDFRHCDGCGAPCWEHPYRPGFGEHAGLRHNQSDDEARAMWRRWGRPHGLEFRPPSGGPYSGSPRRMNDEERPDREDCH